MRKKSGDTMQSHFDSIDDLEQAVKKYERQFAPGNRFPAWVMPVIKTALLIFLVSIAVGASAWGITMYMRAEGLEQQLATVTGAFPSPVIPSATATATATSTGTATATATSTPSATLTMTNTVALSETPTNMLENTLAPTTTSTSTPVPSAPTAATPVDLSDRITISVWKELCPYSEDKYFDLPPVKVVLEDPDEWALVLENQNLYLENVNANQGEKYPLELTIINGYDREVQIQGTWGKGIKRAVELSYGQCGYQDMDLNNYFWMPNMADPAAETNSYSFQVMSAGEAVSNQTEKVAVVYQKGYPISAEKLYIYPADTSEVACDGNCQDQPLTTVACVMNLGNFYAVQVAETRRLYWARIEDVAEPPTVCGPGVYTGFLP